ncbi:MAG: flagellar motor stator protein MotA [Thermodesulfovibrionales bacterium]|nr:flagellar motor stator protein MotA [Thermodesulfovibrionales bacterium]
MFAIIGIIIVFGSVVGGYVLEQGNPHVLFQPVELLIIGGAALGSFFISATPKVFGLVLGSISKVFSAKSIAKDKYLELLSLLYQLFSKIRKEGLISIEADIENPDKSPIFRKYSSVMSNHHALDFLCDNLKVIVSTNVPSHELESLMDLEIDTHHHESLSPSHTIAKISDSMPGLGIVAAVLGVVITMGKIDSPPAVLGHSIGAALVGTFLGILMCYGFVGPMATNLENQANEGSTYFNVIKVAVVAFVGGAAPQMAVEFGRRAIPGKEKPTFSELEKAARGK